MRAGDAKVWDDLMPSLHRVCVGACADLGIFNQQREDVMQDVALKVFTSWETFQGNSRLTTWMYAIARNCCLDVLRRARTRREVSTDAPVTVANQDADAGWLERVVDESQSNMEQRLCVQQVLASLDSQGAPRKGSRRMSEVLRWIVENDPTSEELASWLQTTSAAARERKRYLVQQLRELCRRFCGHGECALSSGGTS